jgi:hypothetical protein
VGGLTGTTRDESDMVLGIFLGRVKPLRLCEDRDLVMGCFVRVKDGISATTSDVGYRQIYSKLRSRVCN